MQLDRSAAVGHFEGCLYAVIKLSRERAFRSERHRRKGFSAAIAGIVGRNLLSRSSQTHSQKKTLFFA